MMGKKEQAAHIWPQRVQAPLIALWAAASLFFVAMIFTLAAAQREELAAAYEREWDTAALLTGKLLLTHPEMETELAIALEEGEEAEAMAEGARMLTAYGYSAGELSRAQESGQSWRLLGLLLGAALVSMAAAYGMFALRDRRRQERLREVLEALLAEDYSKARELAPPGRLHDLLWQLSGAMRLKNVRMEEEKERTKALVTDISHQLKTPIAALGTCFALLAEAEEPAERQEFLQRSRQQITRLEKLTAALVNISRLECAMIHLEPQWVCLNDLLLDAVNGVYHRARERDITIALEGDAPYVLWLDRHWSAEAVVNVLDNAIKYSPSGGQIIITASRLTTFVRIAVSDQGLGIAREEYGRIFQRFYRGGSDAVKQTEGAGVGLYLAREILEREGGGISVHSAIGAGSTFYLQFRLPEA